MFSKKNFFITICLFCAFTIFASGKKDSNFIQTNQNIQRIVSLSPAITEMIFILDAENLLVGRTDYCNWPEEALSIESVGGFDGKTISLEKILTFQPDLVCLTAGMHDHLVPLLKKYGIEVFISSADSVNSIFEEIKKLGKIINHIEQSEKCVNEIINQIENAKKLCKKNDLSVFWEISSAPYFTCGKNSFITDLLNQIGVKNIFGDINLSYLQVNEESIIKQNPSIIIYPDYMKQKDSTYITNRINWQEIDAVKNNRVYPVDSDLFSRCGPRIGTMALALANIIFENE